MTNGVTHYSANCCYPAPVPQLTAFRPQGRSGVGQSVNLGTKPLLLESPVFGSPASIAAREPVIAQNSAILQTFNRLLDTFSGLVQGFFSLFGGSARGRTLPTGYSANGHSGASTGGGGVGSIFQPGPGGAEIPDRATFPGFLNSLGSAYESLLGEGSFLRNSFSQLLDFAGPVLGGGVLGRGARILKKLF